MYCNQSRGELLADCNEQSGGSMERQGDEVHLNEEEATGASKPHVVRWVLGISLILAVVAMSLVWIIPAIT